MGFLDDLKRKLGVQQPRQAWDERIGASPDDMLRVAQSSADVQRGGVALNQTPQPYSQNINPTVRPQPQPAPRFLNNVRAAVSQPAPTAQPAAQPTLDQALMSGGPTQAERPQQQAQPQGMQRNPYRDQLAQDEAQLRALEDKKDKFWKRAVIAGINAGQAGFGYQPTQIQTSRGRDILKTQGRIARDLKIGAETSQMDSEDALRRQRELEPIFAQRRLDQAAAIQDAKLEVERQRIAGNISKQEADRQQKELDRQSREKIAADRVTSQEKIAGLRNAPNSDKSQVRQAKAGAAQAEYDQLVKDEQTAGENKNKAYDYLSQLKANPNVAKEDIAQATKAAEEADKLYQSYAPKKVAAQRRARENQVAAPPQSQGTYSGKRFSRAKVAQRAQQLGMTPEQAEKQITDGGGIIY